MDKIIPKEQRTKAKQKRWFIGISIVAVLGAMIYLISYFLEPTVSKAQITMGQVDKGALEVSIAASGNIMPAYEESVIAPIESRIKETFHRVGDTVTAGTPLLQLDLQTIETNYHKMQDELKMKQAQLAQLKIKSNSDLSNKEMQIKVSDMQLNKMAVEVRNEQYLDSIGAGTTDKVREAQLRYQVAKLEQEQAHKRLLNDKSLAASELEVAMLDLSIYKKSMSETKRLIEDAKLRSPRNGVITYIDEAIGALVSKGTQLAIISDLSHYKVEADISDSYANYIKIGNHAIVRFGNAEIGGMITNVTPRSQNGVIHFSVRLDEDNDSRLRSGLKADVDVLCTTKSNVMRLPNGPYYKGAGSYSLFVQQGNNIYKRKVLLGESNYKFVEVISGLNVGDKVVIDDFSQYKTQKSFKLIK